MTQATCTQCNYSNDYYGDRICTPAPATVATDKSPKA